MAIPFLTLPFVWMIHSDGISFWGIAAVAVLPRNDNSFLYTVFFPDDKLFLQCSLQFFELCSQCDELLIVRDGLVLRELLLCDRDLIFQTLDLVFRAFETRLTLALVGGGFFSELIFIFRLLLFLLGDRRGRGFFYMLDIVVVVP